MAVIKKDQDQTQDTMNIYGQDAAQQQQAPQQATQPAPSTSGAPSATIGATATMKIYKII